MTVTLNQVTDDAQQLIILNYEKTTHAIVMQLGDASVQCIKKRV